MTPGDPLKIGLFDFIKNCLYDPIKHAVLKVKLVFEKKNTGTGKGSTLAGSGEKCSSPGSKIGPGSTPFLHCSEPFVFGFENVFRKSSTYIYRIS